MFTRGATGHKTARADIRKPVTAHWERSMGKNDGYLHVEISGHTEAGWVNLTTCETGRKATKQTMVTLDRDEATALRDWLSDLLAGPKAEG